MDQSIADEYKSSLNDLNFNSKPLINMLTMLADENKKHAPLIVKAIISHIDSASSESRLPGLYLVDSILKNLGEEYLKIFCEHITSLFSTVFEKVDENTRSLMFKLRQTWIDILPNKVLYNLDVSVKKMDPAWPITAKNPVCSNTAKNPPKRIMINPKLLDGSVEQKPETAASSIAAKKENKIKHQQGEVLKQLLVKQEQLRQLEFKKFQLTIKKKATSMQNRDPRLARIRNTQQNVSTVKTKSNSVLPGKNASNCDIIPPVSFISDQEKSIVSTKSVVHSSINDDKNSVNNSSSERNIQATNELPMSHRKVSLKYKCDRVSSNQNKLNVFNDKIEARCSSKESSVNLMDTDESCKNKVNFAQTNVNCPKEFTKRSVNIPKKKYSPDRNKGSINAYIDTSKKNVSYFPKKKENLKTSPDLGAAINKDKKFSSDIKDKLISDENLKTKKDVLKLDKAGDIPKTVLKINDSIKIEPNSIKTESHQSDIKTTLYNYKDLKTNSVLLNEEVRSKSVLKREIEASDSVIEVNEEPPPRKKNKSEDIENYNPDYRNSPVLFGSEDQDLRQSNAHNIKSKDWSQYKESNPDKYGAGPDRHEYYAGNFRSRKFHFSDFRHRPFEHDRGSFFRRSRGRYASRRNARRIYFPRNFRGRYLHNSRIHSVEFDSYAFLQQTEEKYSSGRISEREYLDLKRDLQKMAQTSEFQCSPDQWPKMQNTVPFKRNQENPKLREGCKNEGFSIDNLRIQEPSLNPPTAKPFILDNEEKSIHFIEDKAFVLMNNKEPLELTFKDEKRDVYIEGVGRPITLGFDGKSVEFEAHGQRHILRFGIPGRELYINNHPYEAQFGGPPIAVRLENGHVYKIHLSGPPPQVVIGNKSQYELFAKYHGNTETSVYKKEPDFATQGKHQKMHYKTPESCSVLDIDMRMKPKNIEQSDALLNNDSSFYSKDMKDVDWRQIPPCSNLKSDEDFRRVFDDDPSRNFETWAGEDSDNRTAFYKDKNNQFQNLVPKESSTYKWEASVEHHPPGHFEKNNVPTSFHEENWYYKDQDKSNWQYDDYNHTMKKQSPSNMTQNFQDQVEQYDMRSNSYIPYSKVPSFQKKQTRNQEKDLNYEIWPSNIDRDLRHNESLNPMPTNFSSVSQKALLPSPPFPPAYPSPASTSDLSKFSVTALSESPDESTLGFSCSTVDFGSELKQSQSSSSEVDVESLFEKLISAGIINTKPSELVESTVTPLSEITNDKEIDVSIEIPEIKLTTEDLKIHHAGVISALYKGLQCETCGIRFKESESDQYSHHLDWHFRVNRKEKDGSKKAISRRWFYEVVDWLPFEEFEDFEDRVPSYFELQVGNPEPEVIEVPIVISVSAANDDQEECPVCNERFELFWVEEEEEWHFRNAVRHDKVTYHPSCYEDFKKTIVTESNTAVFDDVTDDIKNALNAVLNDVLIDTETESETLNELVPSNSLEIVQKVPSVDVHSEEELLEGKPGEEEIIGVISESDMETELNIPTVDSKIIVMQSGGITLKVKAESLQCNPVSDSSETEIQQDEDKPKDEVEEEINFRPPTPDPNFVVRPLVTRGRELSGLCCIM